MNGQEDRLQAARHLGEAITAVASGGDPDASRAGAILNIATALQYLGLEVEADYDKRKPLRIIAQEEPTT